MSIKTLYIIPLCTIISNAVFAQDSTYTELEQYKILNNKLASYYDAPSLNRLKNPVSYTDLHVKYVQEKSDSYIWQKGSGLDTYNVNLTSFQSKKNELNLWGSFEYNNTKTKNVNFNETLDYDYLYPYIMADTVGGNLNNEQYAIAGGISKTINKTTYGLEASFVGNQSIRNRDPRIQNISSNTNITLSASQALNNKYNLALSVFGDRYIQKAKVTFNSELGRPVIFHETGFGNYNKLFANIRDNSEYVGYNYGASISLVPSDQLGWFAMAKYISTGIDKNIKDLSFVLNHTDKHHMMTQLGYKLQLDTKSFLEVGADYKLQNLSGIETKFHSQNSQFLELAKEKLFTSNNHSIGGYLSYQQIKPRTTWTATIETSFQKEEENYILPVSYQKIDYINIVGKLAINQKINKSILSAHLNYSFKNPLTAVAEWNSFENNSFRYSMLLNNYDYKNTQVSTTDFQIKLAVPVKQLQTFFIAGKVAYASAYNLKQFSITSGFVF